MRCIEWLILRKIFWSCLEFHLLFSSFFFVLLCSMHKKESTEWKNRQNFQERSWVSSNGRYKNYVQFLYWHYTFLLAFHRYIFQNISSCRNSSLLCSTCKSQCIIIWDDGLNDEYLKKLFIFLFFFLFSLYHSNLRE